LIQGFFNNFEMHNPFGNHPLALWGGQGELNAHKEISFLSRMV